MDWLGFAKIDFHASSTPLPIKAKDGSSTDLLEICKETVPPCRLNPLLFNGHLQTAGTTALRTAPPVHYRRKIFEADHKGYAGSFTVDFFTSNNEEVEEDATLPPRTTYFTDEEMANLSSDDSRPMLVVLHGLSGGSYEVYLRCGIWPLLESGNWEACVVNSRGCAKSKITSGILYNARATWDVRQTVKWLRQRFPNRPLFDMIRDGCLVLNVSAANVRLEGLGFSLGACILTNYIGEEGSACQLKAAIALANPWNLEVSSNALSRSLIGHHVYQRVLGTAMKKLAENNKVEIKKYTDLDLDKISKLTFLREFDREVQCSAWGYPTENAYYRDASSVDSVLAIRIPFLAINSTDDPICNSECIPYGEIKHNPFAVLCTTSLGGHLGWFDTRGGRWHAGPITNFFNHIAFKTDLDAIHPEVNGSTRMYHAGAEFDPIRRKMKVPLE